MNHATTTDALPRRVRVIFGTHVMCSHLAADRERADRYARLMERRFAGLKVEIGPPGGDADDPLLPHPGLWDRTTV